MLQPDDPVPPRRPLHPGRRLPDGGLGPRQAQELQEGVQGVSPQKGDHPVPPLNAQKNTLVQHFIINISVLLSQ